MEGHTDVYTNPPGGCLMSRSISRCNFLLGGVALAGTIAVSGHKVLAVVGEGALFYFTRSISPAGLVFPVSLRYTFVAS